MVAVYIVAVSDLVTRFYHNYHGHNMEIVLDSDLLKEECPGINTICVDLSNWSDAQAAAESAGDVDILINNAGVFDPKSLLETTESLYDTTFGSNVASVLSVSQVIAKKMVTRKQGMTL